MHLLQYPHRESLAQAIYHVQNLPQNKLQTHARLFFLKPAWPVQTPRVIFLISYLLFYHFLNKNGA